MKPVATAFQDIQQGDIHDYDDIIKYFNFRQVKQELPEAPRSITFVTTGIIPFDGGQTTMLHLGTELSKRGFQVYYLSYVAQSREAMEINAEFNYSGYQGTCLDMSALAHHQSDIWLGTLWESVYVFKDKPGYKMYFVQDYEPYFYAFGDRSYLAKKTYELGLHMISLGPWCAEMIKKNCQVRSPLDVIRFPVDARRYPFQPREFTEYKNKSVFTIAAYTKWSSPRRAPISIQIVLSNCARIAREHGIQLNIVYFGTDQSEQFINGKNLGKLTKKEMHELFLRADFGIAPSMTNFSLVPYEMMSSGLPVIDFYEGTGLSFMPKQCALFCHLDEESLFQTLHDAIHSPERITNTVQHAQAHLTAVTWKDTLSDFMEVINRLPIETAS
ncbi:glycosyltransferase family 4 protein [Sporolactobacillus terrae]|uniref:Glycosyltransferase n=1 Tax=Sporolactobacillus terrae TaxID=269673 RepID=A0ABX5QA19_9BACL|nr:glycosyltransferase family 4 protein [Sporolactobacillus terrae]QAA23485.1 glycosyltransferase [Sporolactobacillus terrae]QAA26455.1 glycosyltransferase [Sporolactobacillus terrae]UAK15547.1 glycosyltransferase family 4 protein [Sporolactobacillus terrae]